MVIRHLKAEDQAVFLAFCQDFYSGGAVLHAVDPDNFRRTFEACVSGNPYTEGFLLEVDGQPAGYILVSHTWSNEVGGMVALLEELYFTPEFRGRVWGPRHWNGSGNSMHRPVVCVWKSTGKMRAQSGCTSARVTTSWNTSRWWKNTELIPGQMRL